MRILRALLLAVDVVAWAAPTQLLVEASTGVYEYSTPIGVGCATTISYPNSTTADTAQPRFSQIVSNPLATFISVHFRDFNLPAGDFVRIRASNPNDAATAVLEYHGSNTVSDFYSASLDTTSVVVELFTSLEAVAVPANPTSCLGFTIDSYNYLPQTESNVEEAVCGIDKTREVACFADSVSDRNINAVIRLLTHKDTGSFFCTGWLIGSEGHMFTNSHCISSQSHASATEYEFMAQGATCATQCNTALGCPGTKPSVSPVLIATSTELDYTLVKLDKSLATKYGYLKMRTSGAKLSERIFVVQHPNGWRKRIAMKANDQLGMVEALDASGCAEEQVAYSLDTRGGSSGSPVIAWSDNAVVALHHCGECPNTAINAKKIVADLRKRNILPANAVTSESTESVEIVETVAPTPASTTIAPSPTPTQTTTSAPTPQPTTTTEAPTPAPTTTTEAPTPAPTTLSPVIPATTTTGAATTVTPSPTVLPDTTTASKTVVDGTILSTATTSSADYIVFNVSADAQVELDVLSMEAVTQGNTTTFTDVNGDCNPGYIDSNILLFRLNADGTVSASGLVATNDDAPIGVGTDDGSVSVADSYLSVFLSKGSYRLVVGPSPLTTEQALAKSTDVSARVKVCGAKISNYGSYRVTLSSSVTIAAKSPNTYIGSQCSASNTIRSYSSCQYHTEADTSRTATVDGTIVRSTASVSVDYIPFTVTTFGRVTIEVSSYESRNGSDYVDVNGFCKSSYIDPVAFLFRANAAGLTATDLVNAGDDDDNFAWRDNRHSVSFRDPYLSLGLPPNKYVLIVGRYPLSLQEAIARAGGQAVDLYTLASCGTASSTGNYRVLLKTAQALATTSPGTFSGEQCPTNQGHTLCTA